MKWPFRRKTDVSEVPAEIQEYYQTEKRERTGIAWLLALGTLIITIGLATLLFFGGRWTYRAIANNDDKNKQTAQTDQKDENSDNADSSPKENTNPSSGTSSTSTSTPNSPSTAQTPPATTPTAPSSGNSQSVAGRSSDLPNTGPADVTAIFALTTAVGAATHYAVTARRKEI